MKKTNATVQRLHVTAFASACGLTWGVFIFMLALATMFWGWGSAFIELLSSVYIGAEGTWPGAFMALGWGFADGFIGGLIFVLLYNLFAKTFK